MIMLISFKMPPSSWSWLRLHEVSNILCKSSVATEEFHICYNAENHGRSEIHGASKERTKIFLLQTDKLLTQGDYCFVCQQYSTSDTQLRNFMLVQQRAVASTCTQTSSLQYFAFWKLGSEQWHKLHIKAAVKLYCLALSFLLVQLSAIVRRTTQGINHALFEFQP